MDRVAIYCRLSEEDNNKDSEIKESESIQNQKSLLLSYALKNNWDVYKIYCDEDYSGVDCKRPDFNHLICDAKLKKFNIILCKTQSRFTRDMEMVEKYIHNKFLEWGIRFVTAVDNVDTSIKGSKKARQINGLINEWYLEDLSENVRAVFNDKRKNGKFIGSYAPYGYKKSSYDHNKLIIDKEAADVVRKIFDMRLSGYGMVSISKWLNNNNIQNPTDYRISKGYPVKSISNSTTQHLWKDYTVRQILQRETYIGNMVQGKNKKVSYKSNTIKRIPKKDWIIVADTHEPIIDSNTYFKVQELMNSYIHPTCKGKSHPLAGKVKCMECGSTMQLVKAKDNYYLRCKAKMRYGTLCNNLSVKYDEVVDQVIKSINTLIDNRIDKNILNEIIVKKVNVVNSSISYQKQAKKLKNDILKTSDTIISLYTDKVSGVIDEEQFIEMNKHFVLLRSELQTKLDNINFNLQSINTKNTLHDDMLSITDEYTIINSLTKQYVDELIEKIEVKSIGKKNSRHRKIKLNIYWNI